MTIDDYAWLAEEALLEKANALEQSKPNLHRCIITLKEMDADIAEQERSLKNLKGRRAYYIENVVAPLMAELGVSSAKDSEGHSLTLRTKYNVTVRDYAGLAKLLESTGDGNLLKTQLVLNRMAPEVVSDIRQYCEAKLGITPEVEQTIHPQTLKKWVREVTHSEEGEEAILNLNAIPDCLSVYVYNDVTVK